MINSVSSAGYTLSGRPITRLLVTGIPAAHIELAHRASFYGIRGNSGDCTPGRIAAENAVREYLEGAGIDYAWFSVIGTAVVDTTGIPTPYAATVDFITSDARDYV